MTDLRGFRTTTELTTSIAAAIAGFLHLGEGNHVVEYLIRAVRPTYNWPPKCYSSSSLHTCYYNNNLAPDLQPYTPYSYPPTLSPSPASQFTLRIHPLFPSQFTPNVHPLIQPLPSPPSPSLTPTDLFPPQPRFQRPNVGPFYPRPNPTHIHNPRLHPQHFLQLPLHRNPRLVNIL